MKKFFKKYKFLITISLLGILFFIFILPVRIAIPPVFTNEKNTHTLEWKNELNLKQVSHNSCASYSSMAYIFTKTKKVTDAELINKNIPGKMPNNYTYPWGITKYLKRHDIDTNIYLTGFWSNKKRTDWIESKINKNNPVIVIVGDKTYLHYLSIIGYDSENFFVYDSFKSGDQNGDQVGNFTMKKSELFEIWSSAVFKRIPINVAITD